MVEPVNRSRPEPAAGTTVLLTVDVEPDCPPYLSSTYRGIEQGIPRLLDLMASEQVTATYFVTGDVARRYPGAIRSIVHAGHELGSHGETHRAFPDLTPEEAREEIQASSTILRQFASVTSFRAPYLRFPDRFLPLLEECGFAVDSSQALYKLSGYSRDDSTRVRRIPVSVTSSVIRLPRWIRNPWFSTLRSPVVLFVHPWEFVDLRRERLRLDCRFRTGDAALHCLRSAIRYFKDRGSTFARMAGLTPVTPIPIGALR